MYHESLCCPRTRSLEVPCSGAGDRLAAFRPQVLCHNGDMARTAAVAVLVVALAALTVAASEANPPVRPASRTVPPLSSFDKLGGVPGRLGTEPMTTSVTPSVPGATFTAQRYFRDTTFPDAEVKAAYAEGYMITEMENAWGSWVVVMSLMQGGGAFTDQVYEYSATFPHAFISAHYSQGFLISQLGHSETDTGTWFVVMSKTKAPVFDRQVWYSSASFPSAWVNQNYDWNGYITSATHGDGVWAVVMTNLTSGSMPSQRWRTSASFPSAAITSGYAANRVITALFYAQQPEQWLLITTQASGTFSQDWVSTPTWPAAYVYSQWPKPHSQPGSGRFVTHVGYNGQLDWLVVTTGDGPPASFDARPAFGVGAVILDQSECGSCWAFSTVESFADRTKIAGVATPEPELSPQGLVSCSTTDNGCDGGYPAHAWEYLISDGTSTCSDVCTEGCMPYVSGNCDEGDDPAHDGCHKCVYQGTCADGVSWATTYKADYYLPRGSVLDIQSELWTNGPMPTCFRLYHNFYTWDWATNPIYTTTDNSASMGGHCVKIVGWGTSDDGQDYWLIANSWGASWGDHGMFKFARGTNFLDIESGGVAGHVWQAAHAPSDNAGSSEPVAPDAHARLRGVEVRHPYAVPADREPTFHHSVRGPGAPPVPSGGIPAGMPRSQWTRAELQPALAAAMRAAGHVDEVHGVEEAAEAARQHVASVHAQVTRGFRLQVALADGRTAKVSCAVDGVTCTATVGTSS